MVKLTLLIKSRKMGEDRIKGAVEEELPASRPIVDLEKVVRGGNSLSNAYMTPFLL